MNNSHTDNRHLENRKPIVCGIKLQNIGQGSPVYYYGINWMGDTGSLRLGRSKLLPQLLRSSVAGAIFIAFMIRAKAVAIVFLF